MNSAIFLNRKEAGELLADRLAKYIDQNPVLFALPKGGIPVAFEVSSAFGIPIVPLIVRKITSSIEPELALGAVGEENVQLVDKILTSSYLPDGQLEQVLTREKQEVDRRISLYRDNQGLPPLAGKIAIIVDDGLATGLTGTVAIEIIRKHKPEKIVLALPVCSAPAIEKLAKLADDVVCLENLADLGSIGNYYYDFSQVTDDEVLGYIKSSEQIQMPVSAPDLPTSPKEEGEEELGGSEVALEADDDTEKAARKAGIKTSRVHR